MTTATADRRLIERPTYRLTPTSALLVLVIIFVAVVAAFPLAWMVLSSLKTPAEAIDRLFMSALSRHATAQETTRMTEYLGKADNPMNGYSAILWALLNSSEFALNH